MDVIESINPGDSYEDKGPVVNILTCPDQINTQNLIHLTQLPANILSGTDEVTGDSYIDFGEAAHSLLSSAATENAVEATRIQFLVIDPISTQLNTSASKNGQNGNTDQLTDTGEDRLVCGQCQAVCTNVLEFLDHKAVHIGRGLGLGCEVCSLTFSRTKSLYEHYRRKHKIELTDKERKNNRAQTDSDTKNSDKRKQKTAASRPAGSERKKRKKHKTGAKVDASGIKVEVGTGVNGQVSEERHTTGKQFQDQTQTVISEDQRVGVDETVHVQTVSGINVIHNSDGDVVHVTDSEFRDLLDKSGDTEEKVLQSVSKAVDIGVQHLATVSGLDYVNGPSVNFIQTYSGVQNNVPSVSDSVIVMEEEDNDVSEFSDQSAGAEKENDESKLGNVPQTINEMVSQTIGSSLKTSNFKGDLSYMFDMPDFYFIAIIERGPRNSISGGKYHFKCLYCDIKLSWRNSMCLHMKDKHPEVLKLGPATPVLNTTHQKLDRKHKMIKMSDYIRLEKTTKPGRRIRGIESQDLPGDFPCGRCGKVFHRLRYLRKHEAVHQTEKNLLCSVCVKSFKTLANLNQHMRTHKEREAYKCSQCSFESTINIAIHAHRQIHKDGCVLCDICGCAYNDKSTLTKHKKVHDPSRPYACTHPGCTWRFKSKSMCSAHIKAHTTKAKFECKICGYAFRQKHHLQRHEGKIHNVKPSEKRCTYTVLPVSFIDEGIIGNDGDKLVEIEPKTIQNEVSLIINENSEVSVDEQFDLESALQSGQLVIATDNAGNTINYEMADMSSVGVSYQSLLPDTDGQQMDSQTILIPQTDGGQIMYQQEEVAETICTEVNTSRDTTV